MDPIPGSIKLDRENRTSSGSRSIAALWIGEVAVRIGGRAR